MTKGCQTERFDTVDRPKGISDVGIDYFKAKKSSSVNFRVVRLAIGVPRRGRDRSNANNPQERLKAVQTYIMSLPIFLKDMPEDATLKQKMLFHQENHRWA